ncbi:hypothetical protein I5907_02365 [Panacibacter sp. DH6]|uniref:Uncharacterized protein n=1 Tax=Panacibacter microcysteis TaxID=2793269 RepID=A0A931GT18_9BACT|nr:hypothetical protein [Panacibacter microcysteis]MBG9375056.1 hypothetical protein [Panacibacter microcysteis]
MKPKKSSCAYALHVQLMKAFIIVCRLQYSWHLLLCHSLVLQELWATAEQPPIGAGGSATFQQTGVLKIRFGLRIAQ